jgi:hypothetical protein
MSTQYNPLVAQLVADAPLNVLGPGTPDAAKQPLLATLSPQTLAEPHLPRDVEAAAACCAGLWLRYDFLDESHRISQDIETPEGSYWHGIMHRRELDFGNAKYWFRRVGEHPLFSALGVEAAEHTRAHSAAPASDALLQQTMWNPLRFVDLCEQAIGSGGALEMLCREIQRLEWDLLFDYCYRKATAV